MLRKKELVRARPLDEFVAAPQRAEHTGCLPGTANSGSKEAGRPDRHCLLAGLAVGEARRYLVVRPGPANLEPLRRFARGPGEIGPRPPSRRLMRASFSEWARLVRTFPGYGKACPRHRSTDVSRGYENAPGTLLPNL